MSFLYYIAGLGPEFKQQETFYQVISNDDDVIKSFVTIMQGISDVSVEIGKLVNYWDRYKPIWDMDKDAFIRRYANTSRPLSSYDMDITR